MIPRGRVDEITKEPNRFEKGHCRLPSRIKPKRIIQPQQRSRCEKERAGSGASSARMQITRNRVVLAEKDIVPDNHVKKEKVQRCNSEQHDVPSFGVRLPVLWDMCTTPDRGLPNILS
jgi:hypothetical protein